MHNVVALGEAGSEGAGALVAARHARERVLFPLLPVAFEDPGHAADLVRTTLSFCDGVAALDNRGDLLGFLTSFESVPDPASSMARYIPQRSAMHLVHGHAIAAHVDPGRIYS